ncbi:MAG TPA: MBL fold metallo-hydrolase [Spirochaetota bacterium]|nr:MBL fold metallo-hydrolase [Spirochaetota bacterium]
MTIRSPSRSLARMVLISLQSGSNGNCVYVESGGVRLLFDAGISGRRARERLAAHGRDIRGVDALIISHDHADHVSCAGVYHRMFGAPLLVSDRTLDAACAKYEMRRLSDVRHFRPGETLRFGHVRVQTIPTPHDGADGAAFVVDDGNVRLAVLTDLGHVFGDLRSVIASADAVFLESNYDPGMLAGGPYPAALKRRISGAGGHLSNEEAAALLAGSASSGLRWVCLAHLSQENNTPEHALAAHRNALGSGVVLHLAPRYGTSPLLKL